MRGVIHACEGEQLGEKGTVGSRVGGPQHGLTMNEGFERERKRESRLWWIRADNNWEQ